MSTVQKWKMKWNNSELNLALAEFPLYGTESPHGNMFKKKKLTSPQFFSFTKFDAKRS